ncbi:MAG: PSD1 and planctomycete cytochrome C domain-containing protein [Planctomycetota bacterium]|nr:PSD1 and planctomycete cytochrome C domain-containing protein [Planctomycetota bacterium]
MKYRSSLVSHFLAVCAVVGGGVSALAAPADKAGLDFFEAKIRPVLVRHCYQCHSAKAAATKMLKGGLQVDTREGLLRGGETGPALIAGQPEQSLLVAALKHDGLEMPPKNRLPASIITDFEKWIRLGAPDPRTGGSVEAAGTDLEAGRQHWAFQPLAAAAPPPVQDNGWIRNDVDRFIRTRQQTAGVTANPRATPLTLLRRLHFNVVGLPPSPEEMQQFTRAAEEDFEAAYRAAVERLLASGHYGERWGRHWLDLVRFAESNGYAFDQDRVNAFQYRDFVIRALNDDMPYDQFVRLQLAGDLLADKDVDTNAAARQALDAVAATGFLVAGPFTSQQTQKERERSRYEQLDDIVHTLGTSLLGLTVGCARCHSHKYDPLPQNDYYRFVSCFKEVGFGETGINLQTEEFQAAQAAYDAAHAPLTAAQEKWEQDHLGERFSAWLADRPEQPPVPQLGAWHHVGPFAAADFNQAYDQDWGPEKSVDLKQTFSEEKLSWQPQPDWADAKVHNTLQGENAANYLFRVVESPSPLSLALSLGADDAVKVWVNGQQVLAKKTMGAAKADQHKLNIPLKLGRNEVLLKIVNAGGGSAFYFSLASGLPAKEVVAAFQLPNEKWTEKQTMMVRNWYRTTDPEWVGLNTAVLEHQKAAPKPNLTQVYAAREKGTSYQFGSDTFKVYFLARGNADNKQGEAPAGFLRVLMSQGDDEQQWLKSPESAVAPRVAAAQWLTDVDHGAGHLLARVIVNRLWHFHFGRGIVATPSDFGTRGELPTHPQLLDWLASELIRGQWKLKPIHRLILTSQTWMQASSRLAESEQLDPENRLWWRRGARRLDAELIRDSLLQVSGRLDRKMFGKGSLDQKTPRRSVYLTVKRGQLIPILQLFDAPDAMQGVGQRNQSTVAPQALAMLNSPFVRELAGHFAKRIRPDAKTSLEAVVDAAYRIALSRAPAPEEREAMRVFIENQITTRDGQEQAAQLAVRDFCQLLFCCNEFIYVD